MTSAVSNIHLDGHGNLDLVALGHGASGNPGSAWTSARVTTSQLFGAPVGGEMMVTASIKQPNPAHALGYWPGFWMLGPDRWPGTGTSTRYNACGLRYLENVFTNAPDDGRT
jgi:hypothetical protein